MAEVVTKAARGQLAPVARMSLDDYLDQWLERVKPTLEASAWTNYRTCLQRYVRAALGPVPLSSLTGVMLSAHYARLLEAGGRGGKPLSPTTVRTVHRVLNKALGDAARDDLLLANPALKATPPKRRRFEAQIWTAEQAITFLQASRRDRLFAAWLVALACGLRRGELAGLRWRDVDLDKATLAVTTQRTTDSDYNIIIKDPKGTGRRTIDLGPGTVAALREHRDAHHHEVDELLGLLGAADATIEYPEYVFVREDLRPYHPQRVTDLSKRAARRAGVPVIRLHDARHSCATLALDADIHPKVVQQLLGHSSWSTTMDLYSHRVDRLLREASERIESLILPPGQA
jgi:integrase